MGGVRLCGIVAALFALTMGVRPAKAQENLYSILTDTEHAAELCSGNDIAGSVCFGFFTSAKDILDENWYDTIENQHRRTAVRSTVSGLNATMGRYFGNSNLSILLSAGFSLYLHNLSYADFTVMPDGSEKLPFECYSSGDAFEEQIAPAGLTPEDFGYFRNPKGYRNRCRDSFSFSVGFLGFATLYYPLTSTEELYAILGIGYYSRGFKKEPYPGQGPRILIGVAGSMK